MDTDMADHLSQECLQLVAGAPGPVDAQYVYTRATLASEQAQVSWALSNLRKKGLIVAIGKNDRGGNLYLSAAAAAEAPAPSPTPVTVPTPAPQAAPQPEPVVPESLGDLLDQAATYYRREQDEHQSEREALRARIRALEDELLALHDRQARQQGDLAQAQQLLENAIQNLRDSACAT